jgi:hypothetical protein
MSLYDGFSRVRVAWRRKLAGPERTEILTGTLQNGMALNLS